MTRMIHNRSLTVAAQNQRFRAARVSKRYVLAILLAAPMFAQPTVAPTPERVGPARGENTGDYNFVQSFETGYRFHTVGGNLNEYRSHVNYGNGIRLLATQFSANSRDGHGEWIDELVVNTQGLGGDPYQSVTFRVSKNRFYSYDMLWRLNEYVNPGLNGPNGLEFAGAHAQVTRRGWQDHDVWILPQSKIRFVAGYSRNEQTGPALGSVQLFDSRGNEFPLFNDVRRQWNAYRVGAELEFAGTRFHLLRGWENFKDDTPTAMGASAGFNPGNPTTLTSLRRAEPYHGNSPFWRFQLVRDTGGWLSLNGRFLNTSGQRNFVFDETAAGTGRFGGEMVRQVVVFGNARRPITAGNLTVTLFPGDRFSVVNHTGVHHTRMEGDSSYREFQGGFASTPLLNYQFLGIQLTTNQTEALFRAANWMTVSGGYSFSSRRIRSIEMADIQLPPAPAPDEQRNTVHAGIVGLRFKPSKPLSISIDGEIGRADRPFYTISERNYHALRTRVQYRAKTLLLSAMAGSRYNFNSVSLAAHSSRSRNYSFDASWTPRSSFSIDAGYSKLHLDTLSAIAYFASSRFIDSDRALYFSNTHAVNIGARTTVRNRLDLYFGYSRVQDTGDGRSRPENGAAASVNIFTLAQTYPLTYQSPQSRISLRLHDKVRLNFGYQYYGYSEEFASTLNYRAHTGYTSLLWSF